MRFALCLILSLILHALVAWRILHFAVMTKSAELEHAPIVISFAEIEDEKAPPRDLETSVKSAMSEITKPKETEILLARAPSPESIELDFEAPAPDFEETISVELASAPDRAQVEGTSPEAKETIVPKYPRGARKRGEEGEVIVKLEIDIAGVVKSAVVIGSSGFAELDVAALNAALGAKFKPALAEGAPIPSILDLKFVFKLK